MALVLRTERLTLRPWRPDDAAAALAIFGEADVARWLSPALTRVPDTTVMKAVLERWILEDERLAPPAGRWAIELRAERLVVGAVALLPLPPGEQDLEIGVQLAPSAWGRGLASEAGHRVAHLALAEDGVEEVFAVVRPANDRAAAMARRMGMEWVGETEKYYDLRLHVYRLRSADLDDDEPGHPTGTGG